MTGAIFSLETVYVLTGFVLLIFSFLTFRDRTNPHRIGSAVFWLILGCIFGLGGVIPNWLTGVLVLALVILDGAGRVSRGRSETDIAVQERHAHRLRNRIFAPVLTIPLVTFAFAIGFRIAGADSSRGALLGLGFGGIAAMLVALKITQGTPRELMHAGNQLNETMGTVNILPQLLAALGVIFTAAGVGNVIANVIQPG